MKKTIYLFVFLMCMFITSCSTTLCYSRIEVFNDKGELVDTFITTRSHYTDRSFAKPVYGYYVGIKNMAIQYPSTYTIKSTLKVTKKDKSKNNYIVDVSNIEIVPGNILVYICGNVAHADNNCTNIKSMPTVIQDTPKYISRHYFKCKQCMIK